MVGLESNTGLLINFVPAHPQKLNSMQVIVPRSRTIELYHCVKNSYNMSIAIWMSIIMRQYHNIRVGLRFDSVLVPLIVVDGEIDAKSFVGINLIVQEKKLQLHQKKIHLLDNGLKVLKMAF